jgi:hypothetical protein
MFPVYGGKCLSSKAVHNWVEKFSQGRSKVADNARPGRRLEIPTEATVQLVEELIRADRSITIDIVATALGCSRGLAYSIMDDRLKFRKVCSRCVPTELKVRDRIKWTEWVCSCNIFYGIEMKEKIRLLLGTNHGCITTDPNHRGLQFTSSSPSAKKYKVSRTPSVGKLMLTVFGDSQGVVLARFQKRGKNVNSASYWEVLLKLRDAIRRKRPGQLARGKLLHHDNARVTQEWELLEHGPQCLPSVRSAIKPPWWQTFRWWRIGLNGGTEVTCMLPVLTYW